MIDYEEDWLISLLPHLDGSVAIKASMYAIPSAMIAVLILYMEDFFPGIRDDLGLRDVSGSTVWNAAISLVYILMAFRTGQAFSRFWEGTGLLHMMRGEWFDTVSNCVSFSISAKRTKPHHVVEFRHTLVRLMSLCHGSALEEIAGNGIKVESIDIGGLDRGTLNHLKTCHQEHGFNKVEVMLHLVQSLITSAHDNGVLKIAPPILSRVYQTLSRGFVNFLNAKKITDTRFPFPFSQLITGLLFTHMVLTPIIITGSVGSKVLASFLTFVVIFPLFSLNLIASELEDPFGEDDNDLPLPHFQDEMNNCLMMLMHTNTDMIPSIRDRCVTDFDKLLAYTNNCDRGSMYVQQRLSRSSVLEDESFYESQVPAGKGFEDPTLSTSSDCHDVNNGIAGNAIPTSIVDSELSRPAAVIVETQAFLAAPAPLVPPQPTADERLQELHPRLTKELGEFRQVLNGWTSGFEGEMLQMHETFAALRAVNGVRGWEAAVNPM